MFDMRSGWIRAAYVHTSLTLPQHKHINQQRKQALKDYAKTAQKAADDVRKAAGQPPHKPLPPGAIAGDLLNKGATPPPRDVGRGLWSEWAVEWTREHWLVGRTAEEEAALTCVIFGCGLVVFIRSRLIDVYIHIRENNSKERREAVHAAVLHAWGGYKQFAWGMDELQPVAQKGQNVRNFCIDVCVCIHMCV